MFHSKSVVNKLNEALSLVSEVLSETQVDDIRTYINVGECNLALEVLCEMLYEDELAISSQAYSVLQEVGVILKMDNKLIQILKSQLTD